MRYARHRMMLRSRTRMAPTMKGTAAHIQAVLLSQPRDCSSSAPIWVPGCGPGFAQRDDLQTSLCV